MSRTDFEGVPALPSLDHERSTAHQVLVRNSMTISDNSSLGMGVVSLRFGTQTLDQPLDGVITGDILVAIGMNNGWGGVRQGRVV